MNDATEHPLLNHNNWVAVLHLFLTLRVHTGFAEPPERVQRWSRNTQSSSDTNENYNAMYEHT